MKLRLIATVFLISLISCKKLGFSTTPQLQYEGVSTTELRRDESIIFTLSFTDKEGDIPSSALGDSVLWVSKEVQNGCTVDNFATYYPSPDFPDQNYLKGTIEVRYTYGIAGPFPSIGDPTCPDKNDTCIFRFALRDKAGNVSDTVSSAPVVIIKN